MIIYSTYCSADKDENPSKIPAIERYKSPRIDMVSNLSNSSGSDLFILSGKYGLLHSSEEIPFYDHLLTDEEVLEHSKLIAKQLKTYGVTEVYFYMRPLSIDPKIKPYAMAISNACDDCRIKLNITHV